MGYTLPSPDSPTERARELMAPQGSILRANNTDMRQPLVDREGFPRSDLDVWASLMDEIAKTLETIYSRLPTPPVEGHGDGTTSVMGTEAAPSEPPPFARVNGVAPGSPAADAGLQREDLIVKFGELRHPQPNLQALAAVVAENENVRPHSIYVLKVIRVLVRRSAAEGLTALRLIPRQGWGGRGSLGCHLVPYTSA
ncbi:hypothetical protein H4582DRAFT_2109507 [Lactarius indigo]|nr:hypothetical protein H4582DRAFT_2109507 [Lactarius indigo]